MTDWLQRRPATSWLLTGVLVGLALLLLIIEEKRDRSEGGSQSYYSQF
jgi:hypothetical protein